MTGLSAWFVATIVAAILNLFVASRMKHFWSVAERTFVLRVYGWALGLRCALAAILNTYAADSTFAANECRRASNPDRSSSNWIFSAGFDFAN